MSVNYLIIGGPQTGKTTFAKKIARSYDESGVYDVQRNWTEWQDVKEGDSNRWSISPMDMDTDELELFVPSLSNCCFVFEESTSLFGNLMPRWVNKHCCVNKAYTGLRSVWIFHSFKDVSRDFLIKADYIIMFKTPLTDREYVHAKAKHLLKQYDALQNMAQYSNIVIRNTDLALTGLF